MDEPTLEELLTLSLVTQMRIYDALLILIGQNDQSKALSLIKAHSEFDNLGPLPYKVKDEHAEDN